MENTTELKVGMGATTGFNGDAYPYTVVEVFSPRKIAVTRDTVKSLEPTLYTEGPIDSKFITNWDGGRTILTKRKNGRWVEQGCPMNTGWSYTLGVRIFAQNPHF